MTAPLPPEPRPSLWSPLVVLGTILLVAGFVGVDAALGWVGTALALLFLAYLVRHLAFAVAAMRSAAGDVDDELPVVDEYRPPVTVLVAAHDEAVVIEALTASLLALEYPRDRLQVIVVDDRSTDGTGPMLDHIAAEDPGLTVVHRRRGERSGKSAALNAAIPFIRGEVTIVFDADHLPRPDVVWRLVRHFEDPHVGAAQGRCVIRNHAEVTLARAVAVDYLSGYMVNVYGRQALFELPAYGGANCAVRTDLLRELGGWNEASVTEDTDLTMRVVLSGRRVRYDVTAVDTEEAVSTFGRFWRQRYRWARGHQQVLRDYWRQVVRTPHLTRLEKVETLMFLAIFHVPVWCLFGLVLIVLRLLRIGDAAHGLDLVPVLTLLFAGPFVELGAGMLTAHAPRAVAWRVFRFVPLFFLFMLVTTRAWVEGIAGREYTWVRTERGGAPMTKTKVTT